MGHVMIEARESFTLTEKLKRRRKRKTICRGWPSGTRRERPPVWLKMLEITLNQSHNTIPVPNSKKLKSMSIITVTVSVMYQDMMTLFFSVTERPSWLWNCPRLVLSTSSSLEIQHSWVNWCAQYSRNIWINTLSKVYTLAVLSLVMCELAGCHTVLSKVICELACILQFCHKWYVH